MYKPVKLILIKFGNRWKVSRFYKKIKLDLSHFKAIFTIPIHRIPSFYLMKKTSILVKLLFELHLKGLKMMREQLTETKPSSREITKCIVKYSQQPTQTSRNYFEKQKE